jgi:hypothetical protein
MPRLFKLLRLSALVGVLLFACHATAQTPDFAPSLRAAGFFSADKLAFSPQYALWSDGADKQRFIELPAGSSIDASDPDNWRFPHGTRLWKTFTHGERKVETRLIELSADGRWRYATYLWRADGDDADLAPARGARLALAEAPHGRYAVPGRGDCIACHGGATTPVLGFSALQLAGARSAGELTLHRLVERGLLRGLPPAVLATPPRIAAGNEIERAALGYLHGNCAHCHHPNEGRVPVRLNLMQRVADLPGSAAQVLRSMLDAPSRFQRGDETSAHALVPGDADASVLLQRMRARDGRAQMPPLGSELADSQALALLARWINEKKTPPTPEGDRR